MIRPTGMLGKWMLSQLTLTSCCKHTSGKVCNRLCELLERLAVSTDCGSIGIHRARTCHRPCRSNVSVGTIAAHVMHTSTLIRAGGLSGVPIAAHTNNGASCVDRVLVESFIGSAFL